MRRASRAVVALLAAASTTTGCGFSLQNAAGLGGGGDDTYRVTAVFAEAPRLPLGGTVRVGQATVGRVAAISTENFRARVELELDSRVRLPAGTLAKLELTSALGEEFVLLRPPPRPSGQATLEQQPVIPLERTSRGPDVESTLAAVGTLLNGSGIDQARTIVDEANAMLSGRAGTINELLARLDHILTTLDDHSAQIVEVIDSMHAVAGQLAASTPTLEAALTDIRPALDTLLAERERFSRLLRSVSSLGGNTAGLIEETGTALTEQLHQLRPLLKELGALDDGLGKTLTDAREFIRLLRQATPGDYLMLDGTINVPLTVAEILDPDLGEVPSPTGGQPLEQPRQGDAGLLLEGGTR